VNNIPNSIANAKVTSIVVNTNDTASFFSGTQLLRTYGTVRNISASEDRQYIVIEENDGTLFAFSVWYLLSIGSQSFTPLNKYAQNAQALYNVRYDEQFALISERIFHGCCSCGGGSDTSFLPTYEYNSALESGQYYYTSGILLMSPYGLQTQDFGDLLADLPDGSWISFYSTDSTDYVVYQVSDYAILSGIVTYAAAIVSGNSTGFAEGSTYTVLFDKAGTGGGGGGVETVTGTAVDNTDPLNPVIDYTPWNDLTGVPEDNEDLVNRVQNSEWIFGSTTGTNTYLVNFSPALTAYQTGQIFWILFGNANTGAATLNANSLGAIALVKGVSTALVSGDIPAGALLPVRYDGANFQVFLPFLGIPTFQQVIIAGATMTQNNTIGGGGFQMIWNNFLRYSIAATLELQLRAGSTPTDLNISDNEFLFEDGHVDLPLATAIASAATTNIGDAADGNTIHITGPNTITSFGPANAGATRELIFDASLTLTHNATSLILLTGANIQTEPGDTTVFLCEDATGNWRQLSYQRASGNPLNYEENIDWTSSDAVVGFSSFTTHLVYYSRVGKIVTMHV